MKHVETRPYAKPESAARRLLGICREVEANQDGRVHIEKINYPFLFRDKGSAGEYLAGLELLKERKILFVHESGTYVRVLDEGLSVLDP